MAKRLLRCAAPDCKNKFSPRVRTQIYCSQTCKNREAQRRLAKRQKEGGGMIDPRILVRRVLERALAQKEGVTA